MTKQTKQFAFYFYGGKYRNITKSSVFFKKAFCAHFFKQKKWEQKMESQLWQSYTKLPITKKLDGIIIG